MRLEFLDHEGKLVYVTIAPSHVYDDSVYLEMGYCDEDDMTVIILTHQQVDDVIELLQATRRL